MQSSCLNVSNYTRQGNSREKEQPRKKNVWSECLVLMPGMPGFLHSEAERNCLDEKYT